MPLPSLRRLQAALMEMAFAIVRDNAVLSKLQAASLAASFVQMYAFAFSAHVPWGQPRVQHLLGYTLLRLPAAGEQAGFWAVVASVSVMLALAAVAGREMVA